MTSTPLTALRATAVAGAAALALAACGSGTTDTGTTGASATGAAGATATASAGGSASASAGQGLKVVYVPGLTGNPFYTTVGCGAAAKAAQVGAQFTVQGSPDFDVAKQTAVVNAVVAARPDDLMISITDATAMKLPLAQAKAAGIKVITIDGDLEDTSIALTNIQSDNAAGGALAAQKVVELTGGKGSVLGINQTPGNPIGEQREKGFTDELAKHPGMKYLGTQYSMNSTATAAQIASTAATTNGDLAAVYTMSTNNTEGAITGVREAGRTGAVKVVGYDVSAPIEAALKAGTVDGVVVQDPYGEGQAGVQSAVDAAAGKQVPRDQTEPFVVATPANYTSAQVQQYLYKTTCS